MILTITQSDYFNSSAGLEKLNKFMCGNERFDPQQMAETTGCTVQDALYIGVLLFDQYHADGFLLVHKEAKLVECRPFSDGFAGDECTYKFEFVVTTPGIQFTNQPGS